jgi:hypothetical protein
MSILQDTDRRYNTRPIVQLYHFTSNESLESIALDGLCFGDIPISPTESRNGVWLTTDPEPAGHGLGKPGPFSPEMRAAYRKITGVDAPANAFIPDKSRIRLTATLLASDLEFLISWKEWAEVLGVSVQWKRALRLAGGQKEATWWILLGTIPPERLQALDLATGEAPEGWLLARALASA